MNTKIKSYPNPVLGNGDNYKIKLDENVIEFSDIEKDDANFYFSVTLNLDDEIINNLIKGEKAALFCDIDCIKTNYRTEKHSFSNKIDVTIPRNNVADNVDVNIYIIAMQPIENYCHPKFNEMYDGNQFNLEIGDFVATLGSFFFNATVKYSKCPSPSSLMQVQDADENSGITKITFREEDERIFIVMPHELFLLYNQVYRQSSQADDLFVTTIAVEALTHALITTRNETTNLAENLRNLLKNKNIEIEEDQPEQYLEAARILLEEDGVDPNTTFMKGVEALIRNQKTD